MVYGRAERRDPVSQHADCVAGGLVNQRGTPAKMRERRGVVAVVVDESIALGVVNQGLERQRESISEMLANRSQAEHTIIRYVDIATDSRTNPAGSPSLC